MKNKKLTIILSLLSILFCLGIFSKIYTTSISKTNNQPHKNQETKTAVIYHPENTYLFSVGDSSKNQPEQIVSEITSDGQTTKMFSTTEIQTFLLIDEKGIIGIRATDGYQNKIVRLNLQGEYQQTLFSTDENHYITGIASSDKQWVVFSDFCGITCKKQKENTNNIYALNLNTNKVKLIFEDKITNDSVYYYIPTAWSETDQNKVIIEQSIEVGEGTDYPKHPLLLDVQTEKTNIAPKTQNNQNQKTIDLLQPFVLNFYKKPPYIIYTNQPDTKEETTEPTHQLRRFNQDTKQDELLYTSPNWIELIP